MAREKIGEKRGTGRREFVHSRHQASLEEATDCGLRTADCELRIADCRPGVKCRLQTFQVYIVLQFPLPRANRKQANLSVIQANRSFIRANPLRLA